MEIHEVEKAVDKIISGKKQREQKKVLVDKQRVNPRFEEWICPERVAGSSIKQDSLKSRESYHESTVCTGRHANVVHSIIAARKKTI